MPENKTFSANRFLELLRAFLIFMWVSLTASFVSHAQQVEASLFPDSILIGKQAILRLEIRVPSDILVLPPVLSDTIFKDVEILSVGRPDTLEIQDGDYFIHQDFAITAWKEGFYPISPISVIFSKGIDTLEVFSEPMLLEVHSVEIGEDAVPFDIKPIFRMPLSFQEILYWAGPILLLLGLAAGFLWWFLKKRKRRSHPDSIWERPDVPAHIAAISSLESLKKKKLWQNGKVKLYYSELSYILRMFLEKRFGYTALEMTSAEILQGIPAYLEEEELTDSLRFILELADLAKFAKFSPDSQKNDECMDLALEFVKRNIPPVPVDENKPKLGDSV